MSEIEQNLNDVEISIDDARKTIAMRDTLQQLLDSTAWEAVVEKGYFTEEASRLVLLKADPTMAGKLEQKQIQKAIDAIGPFRQYLRVIMQLGQMAEGALLNDEQTREELLVEEANEDEGA